MFRSTICVLQRRLCDMRESMRILKHLIINNSINDRDDAELFDLASREDIREELDVMSEEWDFTLGQDIP